MKNGLIILLIPLFLLSTAGVAITSLYCQGKLCEIGFNVHPCCDDVNKGGCCKTETKVVKIEDSYVSSSVSYDLNKVSDIFIISDFRINILSEIVNSSEFISIWDKAPPLINTELYILFHSLII